MSETLLNTWRNELSILSRQDRGWILLFNRMCSVQAFLNSINHKSYSYTNHNKLFSRILNCHEADITDISSFPNTINVIRDEKLEMRDSVIKWIKLYRLLKGVWAVGGPMPCGGGSLRGGSEGSPCRLGSVGGLVGFGLVSGFYRKGLLWVGGWEVWDLLEPSSSA